VVSALTCLRRLQSRPCASLSPEGHIKRTTRSHGARFITECRSCGTRFCQSSAAIRPVKELQPGEVIRSVRDRRLLKRALARAEQINVRLNHVRDHSDLQNRQSLDSPPHNRVLQSPLFDRVGRPHCKRTEGEDVQERPQNTVQPVVFMICGPVKQTWNQSSETSMLGRVLKLNKSESKLTFSVSRFWISSTWSLAR
jgi:hypothetical protein